MKMKTFNALAEKLALGITLLVIAAAAVAGVTLLPYWMAENGLSPAEGKLTLYLDSSGSLILNWPEVPGSDGYLVEISRLDLSGESFQTVSEEVCLRTHCTLPELSAERPVRFRVTPRREYSLFGKERVLLGDTPMTAETYLNIPGFTNLALRCDPEGKRVLISWSGWLGDSYRLYRRDREGNTQLLQELDHAGVLLSFGEGGDLPLPGENETYTFCLDALREQDDLSFFGAVTRDLPVTLADLVYRAPDPGFDAAAAEVLTGAGAEPEPGTDPAPAPEETPEPSPEPTPTPLPEREPGVLYAVIWTMRDLPAYTGSAGFEAAGTALASASYCVLGEENGRFQVRLGPDSYGWIDSNQCMINLPDYLGSACAYDITNSYSSIYRVHGYDIPNVTDTVVLGYEQVHPGEGEYLVPLLYPTARKLAAAAGSVAADGYRLKIYDSFRPNVATRSIYDLTNSILALPLPWEAADGSLTYLQQMTAGAWNLGSFLANGSSMHNFGVAVDLTLEQAEQGEELAMQTVMHDLSWYSVTGRNSDTAFLLDGYMKAAGFGGLVSEWWHFQDNDSYAALPMSNRYEGVTAEGWRYDGLGWRYRLGDGSWCADREFELEGALCRFDAAGYFVP